MKIRLPEDTTRRIGNSAHNTHVANGIAAHRETQVAPSDLLRPFSEELEEQLAARHKQLQQDLSERIGKPFFSDTGFILYHGDCLDILARLDINGPQFHLTVTSPPYNIGKQYETPVALEEYISWCAQWIGRIYDATTPTGAFWLNVGYLAVPDKGLCVPIPYLLWDKSPFYMVQEIVWAYGAGVSAKRRLSPRNEKWLFYIKDRERYTFNLDEIRDPNVKYPNQKKNGKFRCNPNGKNPSDVWEMPKVTTGTNRSSKERTDHPAQFPLRVIERIVKVSSNTLEVVLDPFAGSCSAGLCAAGLGRIFVGIEKRKDYCEMAVKRFQQFQQERHDARKQTTLF
jgi:adenine-specific DNA-methyltransferase